MEYDKNCTVIINLESDKQPSAAELQKKLESSKETDKREALEHIILQMMHGEPHARLLMSVIRFVVTSNDHRIKKLLMLYWEIVDKCKPDGELKEEMILVCNALRNDLMHPNEFIRGSTLRLLCKVRYFKLLEPLVEPICRNLVHRHNYVRRNAVMCVYSLVKAFGADVIPHAPEAIEELLLVEGDLSTKRNAFLFLIHCAQERAVNYLLSVQDALPGLGDIFQLF
uniref:Clathrin/coatomer adaptor adaptin-like N-terminal domain-containing protein n=1 Tax=Chromera velia CCMP2878 TaxID=1169474 RepID=A0A0K6S8R1_9ALVE|eukprot:Cvel_6188.t2-p1 / transcript=Cvel_6188.t2 / gene=Cvel_6188 / organism=Chromera_velia_CCMP2878 / gene_product=Coatomer subunit beta, putative / transcript_product=Coatomer subunit beta, putative / location=Cvel_scaffold299:90724-92726(+) / protein_length=225 / sequence_SO=supercontig / SO=protein_coding / is_pseudo=false